MRNLHALRRAGGTPLVAVASLVVTVLSAESPEEDRTRAASGPPRDVLEGLRPAHPRLLLTPQRLDALRAAIRRGEEPAQRWFERLRERAEEVLSEPPSRYEIPDGKRLLSVSRRVLERISTLALVHRLAPDDRLVRRAWRELQAAAAFPDWNPRHFLDTAEMSFAFALGFDWLYDAWTPEERSTIRTALLEKGLEPALRSYAGKERYGWWVRAHHNWNQVCNGGAALGALAIADEAPDTARAVLEGALASMPRALKEYGPGGGWAEGPGYWHYATRYTVYFLSGLETALGRDFGLSGAPGLAEAGWFPIYTNGPFDVPFNFADCGTRTIRAEELLWLAKKYQRPAYAWYQLKRARPAAFDLVWLEPSGGPFDPASLPLDRRFRGIDVATFRTAWEDPEALFVGFKAGRNDVNHSHLDLGSFVLDALGTRWAVDPGADNYNFPGYFSGGPQGRRWTYFRLRAEGHNTLVIAPGPGPDQDPRARAPIVRFRSDARGGYAVADLKAAYPGKVKSLLRGIALRGRGSPSPWVIVQDEGELTAKAGVWWLLHTRAEVEIAGGGRRALLREDGKRLEVRLLAPASGRFDVRPAGPLPGTRPAPRQSPNPGLRTLYVKFTPEGPFRIGVAFTPLWGGKAPASPAELEPLDEW